MTLGGRSPDEAPLFELPRSEPLQLEVEPRLESWMAGDHPDQVRRGRLVLITEVT